MFISIGNRKLGYSLYGDPKGKPMFYFHGWPASRLSAEIYDTLAKKLHIRIISPDRPGLGLSDYQENRMLLDFPDDIVALADFLKIKKFAIMGVSGGGPYAAACAYKIPKRLTNVGIVVGLGPILGWESLDGMMLMSKIGWINFGSHPLIRRISVLLQYCYAYYSPGLDVYRILFGAKADHKLFASKDLRRAVKRGYQEAYRQGIRGPELDLKLYASDWGFSISDIKAKTYLWYGDADQNVSLNMGKTYASAIKGSTFVVYPKEGHLISITHADDILSTLVS